MKYSFRKSIIFRSERNRALYVWKSSFIREIIDHVNKHWFNNKQMKKTWKNKYYNGGVRENE